MAKRVQHVPNYVTLKCNHKSKEMFFILFISKICQKGFF